MNTFILHGIKLDDLGKLSDVIQANFPGALIVTNGHSDHQDVRDFHHQFEIPMASEPQLLSRDLYDYRMTFLIEELNELSDAHEEGDLHGFADALIDLVYVAHGTAAMAGIPWAPLWNEVQRANMSKVRATSAEQSKRGSALDVIKPVDWIGPNFEPWLGPR